MAKLLITGNCGYVGSVASIHFKERFQVTGIDAGFFGLQRVKGVNKIVGDVRSVGPDFLKGYEAVIHLAAVSNDQMGNEFESVTDEINCRATFDLAQLAKRSGVRSFIFASSCSVYGQVPSGEYATERTKVGPL